MVRAVSKYSLLSISPPQSRFERHNAVELQPITGRGTGPLHRRSSVPYICMRRGYLGLRSTTCAPLWVKLNHRDTHSQIRDWVTHCNAVLLQNLLVWLREASNGGLPAISSCHRNRA